MTGIFVGATIVATRFVIDQTNPALLSLWRYLLGSCRLLPPLLLSARVRFERRDLLPIALLGILQFGIVVALLNFALQFIPSARVALIFASFPLLTMILAAAFGYEQLTAAKALGVVLTGVGVGFALLVGRRLYRNQQWDRVLSLVMGPEPHPPDEGHGISGAEPRYRDGFGRSLSHRESFDDLLVGLTLRGPRVKACPPPSPWGSICRIKDVGIFRKKLPGGAFKTAKIYGVFQANLFP